MKFLIKYRLLLLLVGVLLSACGGAPGRVLSDQEINEISTVSAMTKQSVAVQACATLFALGTPYPCNNPPPSTPTPIPPTSTPTPTPFTGWMHYQEGGGATPMPYGFEPSACDNQVVGCPGQSYRYFINGVPQGPDENTYKGTPSYWPWILVGIPVALAFFLIIGIGVYGATAPQRALARSIEMTAKVQAKMLEMSGLKQPALQAPKDVRADDLWVYFQRFIRENHPDPRFETAMRHHMRAYHRKDDLIPLDTMAGWVHDFDKTNNTNVLEAFTAFADRVDFSHQIVERSS